MRERAESCVYDFAFVIALLFVVVGAEDCRDQGVSAEVEDGELVGGRGCAGIEERGWHAKK